MNISIVSAWKDLGNPQRREGFEFTRRYWRHHFPQAELVVATPDPFTRARGLNAAVARSSSELIVQADPDTIAPKEQIDEALALAAQADGLIVPFERYLYLNEDATARLHGAPLDALPEFEEEDCQQFGYGGCGPLTVYSRTTWETIGGYDERFGLWGGDDGAFAFACSAFFEPMRRINGPALHSYHERLPQSIPGGDGYAEQFALLVEWRDAAAQGPEAVKELIRRVHG